MALIELRAPDGRRWKLREWVQGRPIGVPTHPMFVHFPIALYAAVVVFDVMSRITPSPALVLAGTYLLIGAFVGTAIAALLGLIDWLGMIPRSSKRRLATQHLLVQVAATVFFQVSLLLRWSERNAAQADVVWIVLEVVGYLVLLVGNHLGGLLVYQRGMRVSTGGRAETE